MVPKGGKIIPIEFPLKGLNRTLADGTQPKGTTRDCLNVIPFVEDGRARGGSRGGTTAVSQELAGEVTLLMNPVATRAPNNRYSTLGSAEIEDRFYSINPPGNYNINTATGISSRWRGRAYSSSSAGGSGNQLAWAQAPNMGALDERFSVVLHAQADGTGVVENWHQVFPATSNNTGHSWVCHAVNPWAPPTSAYAIRTYLNLPSTWHNDHAYVFGQADGNTWGKAIILSIEGDGFMTLSNPDGASVSTDYLDQEFTGAGWLELIFDGDQIIGQWKGVPFLYSSRTPTTDYGWGFGGYAVTTGTPHSIVGRWNMKITPAAEQYRRPFVVAVAGGQIYQAETVGNLAPVDGPTLNPGVKPQGTWTGTKAYFVDGTNTVELDLATTTATALVATDGKGTVPANCRLIALWRGRLVLANQPDFPQNIYLSRSGDPLDWLFGQNDAGSAVALNATAAAGRIGQPVYAVIPFRDDTLLIGCDHSLYVLAGDPMSSSGQIIVLSESIGMIGPDAWTQDPAGNIYFVGTGGFYKLGATTSEPTSLSREKLAEWFRQIDRSTQYVEVEWDRDRQGCWIWVSSVGGGRGKGMWFDDRLNAFFEQDLPEDSGPVCVFVYDGDGADDRFLWLGGRDGVIRKYDAAAVYDSTPLGEEIINSHVMIGPIQPGGDFNDTQLVRLETIWGTGTTEAKLEVLMSGGDAASAAAAVPIELATFTNGGRGAPILTRYRANTFYFRISASAGGGWSMERIQAAALPGGQNRG